MNQPTYEAKIEIARNDAEREYFNARPQIDSNDRRLVFRAGFNGATKKIEELKQQRDELHLALMKASAYLPVGSEQHKAALEAIAKVTK